VTEALLPIGHSLEKLFIQHLSGKGHATPFEPPRAFCFEHWGYYFNNGINLALDRFFSWLYSAKLGDTSSGVYVAIFSRPRTNSNCRAPFLTGASNFEASAPTLLMMHPL
jgi:hypothetical protein